MSEVKEISLSMEELIHGRKYHEIILGAVRACFELDEHLQPIAKRKYGAIAFFKRDRHSQEILMNFYPLFPEILQENFPNKDEIKLQYLRLINKNRPFNDIMYVEHFKKTNNLFEEHFKLKIPKGEMLEHSQELINKCSWEDYIQRKTNVNSLDLLFFESDTNEITLLPLPILSSPCILLYLPNDPSMAKFYERYSSIISDYINNYVFNRLMNEIKKDLEPYAITDKDEFIRRFTEEFCDVILPVAYKIDGHVTNVIDWYGDNHKIENRCSIAFTFNNINVEFYLASFCCRENLLIHKTDYYYVREKQFKETINNIFELVYRHWLAINSERAYLESEIKEVINKTRNSLDNVVQLSKNLDALDGKLTQLYANRGAEVNNEFIFKDEFINGKLERLWKLRFNGFTYINWKKDKGFCILHHLISNYFNRGEDYIATNDEINDILKEPYREKTIINNTPIENMDFKSISVEDEVDNMFSLYEDNEKKEESSHVIMPTNIHSNESLKDQEKIVDKFIENIEDEISMASEEELVNLGMLISYEMEIANCFKKNITKKHKDIYNYIIKYFQKNAQIGKTKTDELEQKIAHDAKIALDRIKKAKLNQESNSKKDKIQRKDNWTSHVRNLYAKFELTDEQVENKLPKTIFQKGNFITRSDSARYIPNTEAKEHKFVLVKID